MQSFSPRSLWVAIILLAASPVSMKAASVTFDFTGITTGFTISNPIGVVTNVPLGTPIFGSFSFDASAAPIAAGTDRAYFALTRFTLEVPSVSIYSFSVGATEDAFDNFAHSTNGDTTFSATTENSSHIGYFRIGGPCSLTGNDLVASLTSGNVKLLTASFVHQAAPSSSGTATFQATSVTQAATVPEPTTTVLLGTTLIGMGFRRRRSVAGAA
jgi:hypothetical protein